MVIKAKNTNDLLMDLTQFKAGYIIDTLLDQFRDNDVKYNNVQKLCYWLSHFDVQSKSGFLKNPIRYLPHHAVLINLIQRGLPTRLNIKAFELIQEASLFLESNNSQSTIGIKWSQNAPSGIADQIYRSLHIIDPRITRSNSLKNYSQSWERLASEYEEDFFYGSLPDAIGKDGDFIIQLLASQRKIDNIV